jgi:ubiquitin conjugation factor E4 B
MALKHLMPALMHFYIEVEQTGASSQFYDKFNARRNIAYILKAIWNNPAHREALNTEARNVDKFVRFVNLMINDVTYLMDESLSELTQIYNIQTEMEDQAVWATKSAQYRQEREGTLRQLERHASSYITLGKSTVGLLRVFTAETKAPFMMPEIVDRLAAMLNYNLDALVGPKCQELKVKEPEKYKFKPRELLSDILEVFLNLSDQADFTAAVAGDGRSYKKELFERAATIATRRTLKTATEIEKLRLFAVKVEEVKATLDAEDDLGEIPDEFSDPLMATVMRDPVMLPSSRTIIDRATIKSHLLSDSKDPFNRAPLAIEDVIPQPELKARIEEFLIERRKKATLDKSEEDIHVD